MDWDKNGLISPVEFKSYMQKLSKGEELSHDEVMTAFHSIDIDGSKNLNWKEFEVRYFPIGNIFLKFFKILKFRMLC